MKLKKFVKRKSAEYFLAHYIGPNISLYKFDKGRVYSFSYNGFSQRPIWNTTQIDYQTRNLLSSNGNLTAPTFWQEIDEKRAVEIFGLLPSNSNLVNSPVGFADVAIPSPRLD